MYDSQKHLATQVVNALKQVGLSPADTAELSDAELLKIKNLGPKGLAFLRSRYPKPKHIEVIADHRRGAHVYRVVLNLETSSLVLMRDNGAWAVLYNPCYGTPSLRPEDRL